MFFVSHCQTVRRDLRQAAPTGHLDTQVSPRVA